MDAFTKLITEKDLNIFTPYNLTPLQKQNNNINGRIMGGCLSSFMSLVGTKYDPLQKIDEDFIFVLEDINIDIRGLVDTVGK